MVPYIVMYLLLSTSMFDNDSYQIFVYIYQNLLSLSIDFNYYIEYFQILYLYDKPQHYEDSLKPKLIV
jgi:hypothetical protein